ncbi:unnamed protein product [Caenorhabditis sp. 36 PRJEB53466]|nr:unnamed protein product [Caenorhabditis sp. 36 PRJEB53466]
MKRLVTSTSRDIEDTAVTWQRDVAWIQKMRQKMTAPVDTMGCHKLADPLAAPEVHRFQVLVALMLSSQTRDEVNAAAMKRLKDHGLSIDKILEFNVPDLEQILCPVGFYKRKTIYLQKTAKILKDDYSGDIPDSLEGLCSLPGVGPKMANLVMQIAWEKCEGIAVDTHVHRISNRLGWVKTNTPEKTRMALEALLPRSEWQPINHLLVGFGQMLCQPVKPKCSECLCRFTCPSSTDKKPKKEELEEGEEGVKQKKSKIKMEVKEEMKEEDVDKEEDAAEQMKTSAAFATSKLLFTYFPTETDRKRIMEIMFNKENGLQMLKVEMGGDDQSTEGSESSHMSKRGRISRTNYEFELIKEALQVNPSLPICVLPWAFPGWLGANPYENETETATYVVEWLKIGRDVWEFDTYCVGVWNERNFSETYIKELRRILDKNGFKKTLIVAGEGFRMDDSYPRLLDKNFIDHFDIIGVHYPGGQIPVNVKKSGKKIWASEDFSTDNRGTGMGCMARTMNWNYVHGNITGMLTWHLMSAFYPQLPWWRCGLASLQKDRFQTENAFHVLKYVTGHVKRGWRVVPRGKGSGMFEGGGTYVTYTDGHDLSIIVESMSYEKSLCEYSSPAPFKVKSEQLTRFELPSGFRGLNVSLNFEPARFLPVLAGNFIELRLSVDSFGVLSTLPLSVPSEITVFPPPLPKKYFDDFSDYKYGEEPRFWTPQKGSWEVRNGKAVQKVTRPPISWCTSHTNTPYSVMAYPEKTDLLSSDVNIPPKSNASSVIQGIRSNCSGCDIEVTNCRGIFAEIEYSSGKVTVFSDFVHRFIIAELKMERNVEYGKFYTFTIHLIDSHLFVKFGYNLIMTTVDIPEDVLQKTKEDTLFVIATGNFGISEWDNISTDFVL